MMRCFRFNSKHGRERLPTPGHLRSKVPITESDYYYPIADRRNHSCWVTVVRDERGLRNDVDVPAPHRKQMLIGT
jgi:hypothetical protein